MVADDNTIHIQEENTVKIEKIKTGGTQKMLSQIPFDNAANVKTEQDHELESPSAEAASSNDLIADALDISEEAKQKSKELLQSNLEEMRNRQRQLQEDIKRAGEAGEGMASAMKEKLICLKIAMRIMSGDTVPYQDHRYLAEKDPDLYHQAISMRVEKEDPEEFDRLSEDEDESRSSEAEDTAVASGGGDSNVDANLTSVADLS